MNTSRQLRAVLSREKSVTALAKKQGIHHHTQLGSRLFHALKTHLQADPALLRRVLRSLAPKP